jgi:hypothetical protein
MTYQRHDADERLEILLNFGHEPDHVRLETPGTVLLSTHLDRAGEGVSGTCDLRPDEGLIVALRQAT